MTERYFSARPDEGISDKAIDALASLLHDCAIGCDVHYLPRDYTVEQVHQRDALALLRAIKSSGQFAAIEAARLEPCRNPWHDNIEPEDGPCPGCGQPAYEELNAS